MAHHTTTVWYRFKLPFETVVLPFETVVLLFQNGTTSCLKQDWSRFETGELPVNTGTSGFWYRLASTVERMVSVTERGGLVGLGDKYGDCDQTNGGEEGGGGGGEGGESPVPSFGTC